MVYNISKEERIQKRLDFIGSSLEDLKKFPDEVKQDIELIKRRLRAAEEDYKTRHKEGE